MCIILEPSVWECTKRPRTSKAKSGERHTETGQKWKKQSNLCKSREKKVKKKRERKVRQRGRARGRKKENRQKKDG